MKWQKIYSAWEQHRSAIMGDSAHWYLWASAAQPSLSETAKATAHATIVQVLTIPHPNFAVPCQQYVLQ